MQHEIIQMTDSFEAHAQETENGVEYWLARDLQHLLSYAEWRNFLNIVRKAKTACEMSGHEISDHFVDITKMVELGSGNRPENLPPAEDVKKVARRLTSEQKKALKNPEGLENE